MTVTTQVPVSVGSPGSWTTSSGAMIDALQSLDGAYAISPATSNNMFVTSPSFTSAVQGDAINSVTIRIRARTANVGQQGAVTVGHWTLANGLTMYNVNPGSDYSTIAPDGSWAWYDFVYSVNPETGAAWQAAELPGGDWGRVYLRFYADTSPIHVDQMEIVVDHGGAQAPSSPPINTAVGLYMGSDAADRAYMGTDLVWGSAPGGGGQTGATLYLSPVSGSYTNGDTITMEIRIDSGTELVNTYQANVNYPTSQLQFQSTSTAGSPFVAVIQNTGSGGLIQLSAGILGGSTSGDNLAGTVTFTVVGTGTATLDFAAGSGIASAVTSTNICENLNGASYTIS